MRIAVFGRTISPVFHKSLKRLFDFLHHEGADVVIYKPFAKYLDGAIGYSPRHSGVFVSHTELVGKVDFLCSIGGDGTFLEAVRLVRDSGIPIAGINSGSLGFLADIAREELESALKDMINGRYRLELRSLIKLEGESGLFADFPYALNEFTVHKQDTSQMITVCTKVGGEFLNSYRSDGLIVATPTGSTAYSLSVGGPIIPPEAANFIICPIAPHNLTIRPVVVPDRQEVLLRVEGRGDRFMASLDSCSVVMRTGSTIRLVKAGFKICVLKLESHSFYSTLRSKLMWGVDCRN